MIKSQYGLKKTLNMDYETALEKVTAALKEQGFGVLTEIDVKATLKQKLDVDVPRYKILGACNPPLAHRALSTEPEIGLLLPCNVVVQEGETPESSVVMAIDPLTMMQFSGNLTLQGVAEEAAERLQKALNALE